MPQKVSAIDDSSVVVINSSQKLSQYNIYSGKNDKNFSLEKFNFDSLIAITYQKNTKALKNLRMKPAMK